MFDTVRHRGRPHRLAAAVAFLLWSASFAVHGVSAAEATEAGPPFPDPVNGQTIYDTAGRLSAGTIRTSTLIADRISEVTGGAVAIYTQTVDDPAPDATAERAGALLEAWSAPWPELGSGIVVLVEASPDGSAA